ncbi:MAG TPA: FAD-binding oxidoreductase [Actinomycetota bacterium]|nr:FAD-binding oxidoreductase [Actinomycetota bacterium]
METFDVGVIGAGIHGVAAAYHLSGRGVRTVLVDPRPPAGGPTGASSAICRAYYTNPFLAACARDAIAMLADLEALTGTAAGLVRTGFLYLHPPRDASGVAEAAERLNAMGIAVDLVAADAIPERAPGFDLAGVGVAAFEHDAGYADPHAVTDGLFRAATRDGLSARIGRSVVDLAPQAPAGATLTMDDGERVACGAVLIAAGPWTKPLAAMAGADLPLTVERHVVATFHWADVEPARAHTDLLAGYYFRPEGDDLYLVGPTLPGEPVGADDDVGSIRPDETEALARAVTARVPRLAASQVHGGWASLYDVSPDWQPVIGTIAPGVVVDAGTSGHGFKLAPALGAHVASLVLGEAVDPGLAPFDPSRFAAGKPLSAGYGEHRILG